MNTPYAPGSGVARTQIAPTTTQRIPITKIPEPNMPGFPLRIHLLSPKTPKPRSPKYLSLNYLTQMKFTAALIPVVLAETSTTCNGGDQSTYGWELKPIVSMLDGFVDGDESVIDGATCKAAG